MKTFGTDFKNHLSPSKHLLIAYYISYLKHQHGRCTTILKINKISIIWVKSHNQKNREVTVEAIKAF